MGKLTSKLFKLRNEIGSISKDTTNPFYKSKYFDINTLISQLDPYLYKYEVDLQQPIIDGKVYSILECVESGEKRESYISLTEGLDAQKKGSEITYYRRYTLSSLLGLQAEDDDGNSSLVWLSDKDPKYKDVVKALENKKASLEDVRKKFRLNRVIEDQLKTIINNNKN